MKFIETPIHGAYLISLEPKTDHRGSFSRAFCEMEFTTHNLIGRFVQANLSYNKLKGTLRGMHYQLPPSAETKLVRCIHGALYDVLLDIRPGSPTHGHSAGFELTASNRQSLYVPKGCAHGFLTLTDDTEVMYFVDEFYAPDLERGIRWDDPAFGIEWPIRPVAISHKDRSLPDCVRSSEALSTKDRAQ